MGDLGCLVQLPELSQEVAVTNEKHPGKQKVTECRPSGIVKNKTSHGSNVLFYFPKLKKRSPKSFG